MSIDKWREEFESFYNLSEDHKKLMPNGNVYIYTDTELKWIGYLSACENRQFEFSKATNNCFLSTIELRTLLTHLKASSRKVAKTIEKFSSLGMDVTPSEIRLAHDKELAKKIEDYLALED